MLGFLNVEIEELVFLNVEPVFLTEELVLFNVELVFLNEELVFLNVELVFLKSTSRASFLKRKASCMYSVNI